MSKENKTKQNPKKKKRKITAFASVRGDSGESKNRKGRWRAKERGRRRGHCKGVTRSAGLGKLLKIVVWGTISNIAMRAN